MTKPRFGNRSGPVIPAIVGDDRAARFAPRAEASAESAVDFLVVLPEAPASARKEMARLSRLLYPLQVWADVLVTTAQRFRESAAIPGTLHHNVTKEGNVLYGRLG